MSYENIEVKLLKALAHPIRIKILKKLINGPLCVCELNEDIEFTQSNLSQHLRILRDASILDQYRDGSKIIYSIKYNEVKEILNTVQKIIVKDIEEINKNIGG